MFPPFYSDVWSRTVKFDTFEDIHYRYFVCRMFQSDNEDEEESVVINRWETNIKPRVFSLQGQYHKNKIKLDIRKNHCHYPEI